MWTPEAVLTLIKGVINHIAIVLLVGYIILSFAVSMMRNDDD